MANRPSVGRIVHYVSYGSKGGKYPETCRAAIVSEISDERADQTEVGLAVLNPTGVFFDRQVRQDEETKPGGTWHWPERVTEDKQT